MGCWMFGGEPPEALESEKMIRRLKEWLEDGTFNRLAANMLLNRENMVIMHTLPSLTLGEEKRAREAEKLHRLLDGMTSE